MTPEQARMARALLRMTTRQCAEAADISKDTVVAIEAGRKGTARPVTKLRDFFESKGVFFHPGLDTMHGPAVALRWGVEPPADDQEAVKGGERGDDEALQSAAWDEEDISVALSPKDIDELRDHWSDADRWERLSEPSRKALARAIGDPTPHGSAHG